MGRIATVGTFDGIHRGHKEILAKLRDAGMSLNLTPVAISFSNHPLSVIAPHRAPKCLISNSKKHELLSSEGVIPVILEFTPEMCSMTAREWLENLRDNHDVEAVVIGYDNTFGCDGRSLGIEDYRNLAADLGLKFFTTPELSGISSSKVRHAVAAGDMESAAGMLGYPFFLEGEVVKGDQIGRTIGVPTANLLPDEASGQLLPPFGAYASRAILPDGREFPAVTNIGLRPTVKDDIKKDSDSKNSGPGNAGSGNSAPLPRIEIHIIGFDGDLYGSRLKVELLRFLRPEMKFPSLAALKSQIEKDISSTLNDKP